jgi:hypothetical protein
VKLLKTPEIHKNYRYFPNFLNSFFPKFKHCQKLLKTLDISSDIPNYNSNNFWNTGFFFQIVGIFKILPLDYIEIMQILPIRWPRRSQPSVEVRSKIKHNTLPFPNASEKKRLQTNAMKIKLEIRVVKRDDKTVLYYAKTLISEIVVFVSEKSSYFLLSNV